MAERAELESQLARGLDALGLEADPAQRASLIEHLLLIQRWNRVYNLTAVRDPAEMVGQHLLDSLAAIPALNRHLDGGAPAAGRGRAGAVPDTLPDAEPRADSGEVPGPERPGAEAPLAPRRVLDVGSGAGLPGVVFAIMRPDLEVTCVDAVAKKAGFIRQVAGELGLSHLRAEHARVEDLATGARRFDVITARAFASLADFVALTEPLLAPAGVWMAMKGREPEDEMAALPPTVHVFHVEPLQVPGLEARRCLVWMKRKAPA